VHKKLRMAQLGAFIEKLFCIMEEHLVDNCGMQKL
jgi:hypothetical protein